MADETKRPGRAKTLVVYYSLTGNTARVARDIAQRTGGELESIRDRKHGTGFFGFLQACFDALRGATVNVAPILRDPCEYALTIVGTPVWVGNITPAVRGYLQKTQGHYGRIAFFVTSGNTDVTRVLPKLEAAADAHAVAAAGFNAEELKEQAVYEAKLSAFLNELQWQQVAPQMPTDERVRAI